MSSIPLFQDGLVESLAKFLGDCGTGSVINRVLQARGISDNSGESTKWRRLYYIFLNIQNNDRTANRILDFVKSYLSPERFVGRNTEFEKLRIELNSILILAGLEFCQDGNFRKVEHAKTLQEAERRVRTIRAKFQGRQIHSEVLKYCRTELMEENYFHAVFEATKGLAERIRNMTGLQTDGAKLIDYAFLGDRPKLAFNKLQSETEISEHKGFAFLLKGCLAAIRNPLAHEPKILWEGEDDAADYLSLISLLHRRLDNCVSTCWKN